MYRNIKFNKLVKGNSSWSGFGETLPDNPNKCTITIKITRNGIVLKPIIKITDTHSGFKFLQDEFNRLKKMGYKSE